MLVIPVMEHLAVMRVSMLTLTYGNIDIDR